MSPPTVRLGAGHFFGNTGVSYDAADLMLRETVHGAHQVIPIHVHEAPHFCLGVSGSCEERLGSRRIDCRPGTVEFHPAGTSHASRWNADGGRCFTVTLGTSWRARWAPSGESDTAPHPGLLGGSARALMARLHRETRRQDACSELVVEGLVLALIGDARREALDVRNRQVPPWFAVAEEYVRDFAYGHVSVAAAAREAGVSPVTLGRWFLRVHRVTVGDYVRQLRVDRACALLTTTRLSISDIAHASGFADHAHLTRAFRRQLHDTPSAFRARGASSHAPVGPWVNAPRGV